MRRLQSSQEVKKDGSIMARCKTVNGPKGNAGKEKEYLVLVISECSSSASMVNALTEAGCGISALIHLISSKLFQNNLLECDFALTLSKFKAVLLLEGQFPFLLCGGISALTFCHWSLLMGCFFTVLSCLYFYT